MASSMACTAPLLRSAEVRTCATVATSEATDFFPFAAEHTLSAMALLVSGEATDWPEICRAHRAVDS